ncbi:hypothetical protein BGX38DRAFT_570899 [Terfezia claveryi]|nr:hypothetical protein BGX38DRAFT_570899 [Terfezia claveryi]
MDVPEYIQDDGLHVIEHGGENPTVDIIAVHGLAANPVYTWIKKVPANNENTEFGRLNSNGEREVMWLKHLLPAVIPCTRILKFNYGSTYLVNAPRESLRSLAERLANTIHTLRTKENTIKRPLIFIGHSFGGIVIQEALLYAGAREEYQHIASSVCGIVFLGTPFRGSKASSWGVTITNCASVLGLGSDNRLLKTLKEGSERLDILLKDFLRIAKTYDMRLECFYETKRSSLGKFGVAATIIEGRWLTNVLQLLMAMNRIHWR